MIHIQSPFLRQIPECKHTMRKLRKKIYKYTSTHQPTRKPKESIHGIMSLLKNRNLPDFLIDPLKKRRNFDLSSIKNVIVPEGPSFKQITSMTSKQESEIGKMFQEHRARLSSKNANRKYKKQTSFIDSSSSCEENKEFKKRKKYFPGSQQCKGSFQESVESESSSIRNHFSEMNVLFKSHRFLEFEGDLYSQDQWLNF